MFTARLRSVAHGLVAAALLPALLLVVGPAPPSAAGSVPAWPMHGQGVTHQNRSTSVSPTHPVTSWSFPTGQMMNSQSGPVVGADGSVYATTWLGFFALDPAGTQRCSVPLWASAATPALSPDEAVVYVPDGQGLHALRTSDCSTVWDFATDISYSSPTVGPDGTVYFGSAASGASHLYALTPAGGVKWSWDSGSTCWIESSPAVGPSGEVYVVHNCLGLTKVDSTGHLQWSKPMIGEAWNSPTVGPDGTVYVGDSSGMVAVNPDSSVKWATPLDNWMYDESAAVSADGSTVYRGDNGGLVHAFDTGTGDLRWTFDTGYDGIVSTPALSANGVLTFAVDADGAPLLAVSAADGALLWQADIGPADASPVIGATGTVYAYGRVGGNAVIYALGCGADADGNGLGENCDPPETTLLDGPSGTVTVTSATFTFTADEAGSSFGCALDGGSFSPCTSPKSYSALAPGRHEFRVRATDTTGNTDPTSAIAGWTVSEPARPDLWISTSATSRYVGDDVFNTTGEAQTRTVTAPRGTTRTFYVRLYNDGGTRDVLVLHGSRAPTATSVRFSSSGADITAAMRSEDGWPVRLAPGAHATVRVVVRIRATALIGSRKKVAVLGASTGDVPLRDLVKAVVRVVR